MRACVPRLLSGLNQLFHLCLFKHALTVWKLTSTLACLVTKQCLMVFGRQTFIVCSGPYCIVSLGHQNFDCRSYCGLSRRMQSSRWNLHHKEVQKIANFAMDQWKMVKLANNRKFCKFCKFCKICKPVLAGLLA